MPRLRCGPARAGPHLSFSSNAVAGVSDPSKIPKFFAANPENWRQSRLAGEMRRNAGGGRALLVGFRSQWQFGMVPAEPSTGAPTWEAQTVFAEADTRRAGLSNTITLDTKALRSDRKSTRLNSSHVEIS